MPATPSPSRAIPTAPPVRRGGATAPERGRRAGHLGVSAGSSMDRAAMTQPGLPAIPEHTSPAPVTGAPTEGFAAASSGAFAAASSGAFAASAGAFAEPPAVWLIALATPAGGMRPIEGAGRTGAVRVGRPYGHLRSLRPVMPEPVPGATPEPEWSRLWAEAEAQLDAVAAARTGPFAGGAGVPAERLLPHIVSAVEVETDAGIFRVERADELLTHTDLAWALAHLEPGEPDSVVPLPRRQLALLLSLLPPSADPECPEEDPTWGWAHRLRGPWERGALHATGKLGRLIAIDPDLSGRGMHRACFELLGTEEVVWAAGVPCFRAGSVYELVPLTRRGSASRWLTWPLGKGRRRAGMPELPRWEIARAVYRVGAPRWPLAGVVQPLGPLGVAG